MKLYLDIETQSKADLRKVGVHAYAHHPSTKLNCLAFAVDDAEPVLVDYETCQNPQWKTDFTKALKDPAYSWIVAHNAEFEYYVLNQLLGSATPGDLRSYYCTMAACAYYGYPRGLDDAAKALNCPILKDTVGGRAMRELSTGKYTPEDKPEEFNTMYEYCKTDVKVMREIDKKLPPIPDPLKQLWNLSAKINGRGVPIDAQAVDNAVSMKQELSDKADADMKRITGGTVETIGQVKKLLEFCSTHHVNLKDATKDTIKKALAFQQPEPVREALELRQKAGLSSLSKYESMQKQRVEDRLYGMFNFYGAHTGRWTGVGPQLQNLPRSANPEITAATLSTSVGMFKTVFPDLQGALKDALRGVLKASAEHTFVGVDLSQIEARATAWLAGEQKLLDMFASGEDVYCTYASQVFGETITPEMCHDNYTYYLKRLACKAQVLGFGFAGGIGAMQRVSENYGLNLFEMADIILPSATPAELMEGKRSYDFYYPKAKSNGNEVLSERPGVAADILKQRYRRDFPAIVAYWDILYGAFRSGGQAGMVNVEVKGSGLRIITLPSGRQLYYQGVRVAEDGSMSFQGRKGREKVWKGLIMENCAQAVNMDISSEFMSRADQKVGSIVHHCHDEFTMEVLASRIETVKQGLQAVMATPPKWTKGLPIASEMWSGERYGK